MLKLVLDTNVLVSALLNPNGAPAKVLDYCFNSSDLICYDSRILEEYENVLNRQKFGFNKKDISIVLKFLIENGFSVLPNPIEDEFVDEGDKKFYEVAKACGAILITGNIKHFPKEEFIVTPNEFLNLFLSNRN